MSKPNAKYIPPCKGYKYWTDCGYEYDCESEHDETCDYCLAAYHETEGLWNPETGKKVPRIIAWLLYGTPKGK